MPFPSYVANLWKVGEKLGEGSFGCVHMAKDLRSGETVAVKIASQNADDCLHREHKVYRAVEKYDNGAGIPRSYYFGSENGHAVLVLEHLGTSLHKHRESLEFSTKSVLMISIQALKRIESLHSVGFIHRDLTPMNLLMGYRDPGRVYLIDFGLAKRYKDKYSGEHIRFCGGKGFIGTDSFAATNAHLGREQSRRDDLEALGYCLIYLLRKQLPWGGCSTSGDAAAANREIGRMKKYISVESLCTGMPSSMVEYFRYVRGLEFIERPSYEYLWSLFDRSLRGRGQSDDRKFEWIVKTSEGLSFEKHLVNTFHLGC